FVSNRAGGPSQIYCLALDGGEARPITHLRISAGAPVWSADGTRIAFAAIIEPEEPAHAPRVIRKLSYKSDGSGFILNRPGQIFVVDSAGGDARQVTDGDASAMEPAW